MIISQINNLCSTLARACGLLSKETKVEFEENLTLVLRSTYLRNIIMPGERYNNNKVDITQINVFLI